MGYRGKQPGWLIVGVMFSVLCSVTVVADESVQLKPEDEAERDLSLIEFRESLLLSVQRREPEQFVTMLDYNINNGTGTLPGIKSFVQKWRPEAGDSELWSVLEPILTMGGGFVRSERGVQFCAPYVFTHFPDKYDIFGYGAVVKADVFLMAEPTSASAQLARVDYQVLKVTDWRRVPDSHGTEGRSWLQVSLPDGKKGYVLKDSIRSPSDYSACFLQDRKGEWKMVSLSSSDD